jgi:Cytochrome P460
MTRSLSSVIVIIAVLAAVLGSIALAAQDKYTLRVPNGLAFSEFRGYENWQDVAVSQTETGLKVIAANTAMIDAYRAGIPGNGKPFSDGSKIVKIEWSSKKSTESPYFVMVPDTLKSVSFIEKDTNTGSL